MEVQERLPGWRAGSSFRPCREKAANSTPSLDTLIASCRDLACEIGPETQRGEAVTQSSAAGPPPTQSS